MPDQTHDHTYKPALRATFMFKAHDLSNPKENTPTRVTLHLPAAILDNQDEDDTRADITARIKSAPPPVIEMTKLHTNTLHSLYINDGAIKRAALQDEPGVREHYEQLRQHYGDQSNAYLMLTLSQMLSIAGLRADQISGVELPPTDDAPDNAETAIQDQARDQAISATGDRLFSHLKPISEGQLNRALLAPTVHFVIQAYHDLQDSDRPTQAFGAALHKSFITPITNKVSQTREFARLAPYQVAQGIFDRKRDRLMDRYLDEHASTPDVVINELDASAQPASGMTSDPALRNLDPSHNRIKTIWLEKGDFQSPIQEGYIGAGCEHTDLSELLKSHNLAIDTEDLASAQHQTQALFAEHGHDWTFSPDDLGASTWVNGLGVTEPGWFPFPDTLEPTFIIRSRQSDGSAPIANRHEPVHLVCHPHPETDMAVKVPLDSAEHAATCLDNATFRSAMMTRAADHIESILPDIAQEIRDHRTFDDYTLDLTRKVLDEERRQGRLTPENEPASLEDEAMKQVSLATQTRQNMTLVNAHFMQGPDPDNGPSL